MLNVLKIQFNSVNIDLTFHITNKFIYHFFRKLRTAIKGKKFTYVQSPDLTQISEMCENQYFMLYGECYSSLQSWILLSTPIYDTIFLRYIAIKFLSAQSLFIFLSRHWTTICPHRFFNWSYVLNICNCKSLRVRCRYKLNFI